MVGGRGRSRGVSHRGCGGRDGDGGGVGADETDHGICEAGGMLLCLCRMCLVSARVSGEAGCGCGRTSSVPPCRCGCVMRLCRPRRRGVPLWNVMVTQILSVPVTVV